MIALRLGRVILHLLVGLAMCALVFPLANAHQRSAVVRRWSGRLLKLCHVEVRLEDAAGNSLASLPDAHALIVANHISWLDIFAINAARPCHFVAKADIRHWPLIGWLCARGGTIFIARGQKIALRDAYRHIVQSLRAGERIAFFPEGTTAGQQALLPFHSNLFECALEAGVPVQPYALRYLTPAGDLHPAVEFTGETTFAQSMFRILRGGPIVAQVIVLPALPTQAQQRRALADQARLDIARALGLPEEMDAPEPQQPAPAATVVEPARHKISAAQPAHPAASASTADQKQEATG